MDRHRFDVFIETTVTNKNGKSKTHTQRAESFLIGWIAALNHNMGLGYIQPQGVKFENDTVGQLNSGKLALRIVSSEGSNTTGIIVGTGTTSVSVTDNKLQTKITHGSGAGQLLYSATVITAMRRTTNEAYFRIWRTFANVTTSNILVTEMGLIGNSGPGLLLERSRITALIPIGGSLMIGYKIRIKL